MKKVKGGDKMRIRTYDRKMKDLSVKFCPYCGGNDIDVTENDRRHHEFMDTMEGIFQCGNCWKAFEIKYEPNFVRTSDDD